LGPVFGMYDRYRVIIARILAPRRLLSSFVKRVAWLAQGLTCLKQAGCDPLYTAVDHPNPLATQHFVLESGSDRKLEATRSWQLRQLLRIWKPREPELVQLLSD
jgi:hypothetical protein